MGYSPLFFPFRNVVSALWADNFRIKKVKMSIHTHNFVETYKGLVGYGADRETDENTVVYYLQKFSDDRFMEIMAKRMTDAELLELFELINRLLRKHLTESEYHTLFLKDDHDT
jgi:hypothetical protein